MDRCRREPRGRRATAGALWLAPRHADRLQQRLLLEIGPPVGEEFVIQSNAGAAVVSPDGSMVAFLAQASAARRLYVRSLMTGEARALSGTEERVIRSGRLTAARWDSSVAASC